MWFYNLTQRLIPANGAVRSWNDIMRSLTSVNGRDNAGKVADVSRADTAASRADTRRARLHRLYAHNDCLQLN